MLKLQVQNNQQCGSIELICGAMFSGKSSQLMNKVRRHKIMKHNVLVVNYINDNRYSDSDVIESHDTKKVAHLSEILNIYHEFDVIAIDEGQFFKDIVEVSNEIADNGKIVIIAALDADFRREPFGHIQQLIPIAEVVTKLRSVCVTCRNDASFTKRTTSDTQVELIGSHDIYEPVCRACYFAPHHSNQTLIKEVQQLQSVSNSEIENQQGIQIKFEQQQSYEQQQLIVEQIKI